MNKEDLGSIGMSTRPAKMTRTVAVSDSILRLNGLLTAYENFILELRGGKQELPEQIPFAKPPILSFSDQWHSLPEQLDRIAQQLSEALQTLKDLIL